jgi:hypothetical protein
MARVPLDRDAEQPGEFQFQDLGYQPTEDRMAIRRFEWGCPRRPGQSCGRILIGLNHKPSVSAPSWTWDGDLDRPTLSPSVNCNGAGGCGWHGWVRAGVFVEA